MAEINWTVVTYIIIGVFVFNGFYRGWWKEAITTAFLAVLVFFLQQPGIAEAAIDFINGILDIVWAIIPNTLIPTIDSFFEDVFAVSTNGEPLQIDPSKSGNWLLILLLFLGISTIASRASLQGYRVSPMGSMLGGIVGGLNGFIVISLVREYLKATNLPRNPLGTEIASSQSGGIASSGVGFQAVNVPNITILDSFLPWIIIIGGILVFLMALNNRVALRSDGKGFRKVDYKRPLGYREG